MKGNLTSLTSLAAARTDLEGCVSSKVIFDHYYASYLWYVPWVPSPPSSRK
jgi:hypothetical protein